MCKTRHRTPHTFLEISFLQRHKLFINFASIDLAKSLTTCFNSSIVEGLQEKKMVYLFPLTSLCTHVGPCIVPLTQNGPRTCPLHSPVQHIAFFCPYVLYPIKLWGLEGDHNNKQKKHFIQQPEIIIKSI